MEGLLGLPITSVKSLEIIPTTATSARPVIKAMGNIVSIDFLRLGDKHLRRRLKRLTVLLLKTINLLKHKWYSNLV